MQNKTITAVIMSLLLILATVPSWACEVAGHNKHVGEITMVDQQAGTFTIHDVEQNGPITFIATESLIKDAAKAKARGQVMVSFEEKEAGLVAVDIHF